MHQLSGMPTTNFRIFILLMFMQRSDMFRIQRSIVDTIEEEISDCRNISASRLQTSDFCACATVTTTFMSSNNSAVGCKTPTDLKCRDGVRLLTEFTEIPFPSAMSQAGCANSNRVYVWNTLPENMGVWLDVGDEDLFLSNSQSNFDRLQGHLVMLVYGCNKGCELVKFGGVIEYPFDAFTWFNTFNNNNNSNNNNNNTAAVKGDSGTTNTATTTKITTTKDKTVITTTTKTTTTTTILTSTELIIVIAVPSAVFLILLIMCFVFRRKICRRRHLWSTKRDSTCSKAKMTVGFDNEITTSNMKDPWSPWYDIYKLAEMRRNYLRKPSGDSFHIPTYGKQRNSRGDNVFEMNMGYDHSSRRASSRFSCVIGDNPYSESAH